MSATKQRIRGVRDWDEKLAVTRALLGVITDRELADLIYPDPKEAVLADLVCGSFRKWRQHTPTKPDGPRVFFDRLATHLQCDATVTGAMLIRGSLEQFIQYLPEARRHHAQDIVRDARPRVMPDTFGTDTAIDPYAFRTTNPTLDDLKTVLLHHRGPVESIGTGIMAGRVDQRHYYLTPDTADGWNRLVRAESYPIYDECKAGLRSLVASQIWTNTLEVVRPRTAVMLAGGGAPTKDLVLLRSLLAQPYFTIESITYVLLDISLYMLTSSLWWLDENIRAVHGHERIELKPVHGDALDLRGCRDSFHQFGHVLFGITGGTIGNLSEAAFFRALGMASDDGDLLIVSADTLDGLPADEIERSLKMRYDHADMQNFIAPVARAVLAEFDAQEALSSALKRVKVTLRPGGADHSSDVPGSWCVTLSLDVQGREITLVTSTRYKSSELIAYAAACGWEPVCQIPSPLNPHYIQFGFRRNGAADDGKPKIPT